jgi:hypothetical protein
MPVSEREDVAIAARTPSPDQLAGWMTPTSVVIRDAWHRARCLAGLAALCLAAGNAGAETWVSAGMSFSDHAGGARLLAASGTGTQDDPIVLVEEISGPGPAVLEIHNGRTGHLDVSPATGFLRLSVVKIIANRGPWRWSGFDLELMTAPDQPSVYADGLSFDQPQTVPRQARADRFVQTAREDEPFDRIRFDGGQVDPGQYLRLDFDLVDVNGTTVFYLVQRPITLIARNVPPAFSHQLAALEGRPSSIWPIYHSPGARPGRH